MHVFDATPTPTAPTTTNSTSSFLMFNRFFCEFNLLFWLQFTQICSYLRMYFLFDMDTQISEKKQEKKDRTESKQYLIRLIICQTVLMNVRKSEQLRSGKWPFFEIVHAPFF